VYRGVWESNPDTVVSATVLSVKELFMPKIVQYEGQNTIFPNKHHEYIKEDSYTSRRSSTAPMLPRLARNWD
jgi:hypothetical protein